MPDGGRMDIAFRQDWRGGGGDDVGGRLRLDQSDRLDIADIMVVAAIAPGPTAGEFEDGELLARQELGSRLALARRRGKNEGRTRAALPDERAGVVRREELAGEGHIGEVAAIGVDARVEDQGGAGETEKPSKIGRAWGR